jgi:hypothetical protein
MIDYFDERFLFSASSVVASFGDGVEVPLNNVTLRTSTGMGDEWIFSSTETSNNILPRVVRLILISPEQDWRRHVSYVWKLDSAWMSDSDHGWLHWNSNSFVDSILQIPGDDPDDFPASIVLTCDTMEFHFESILPNGFRRSSDPIVRNTRVVLKDVHIGANLMSTNQPFLKDYSPCGGDIGHEQIKEGRPKCSIVDGAISESSSGWIPDSSSSSPIFDWPMWQLMVLLGLVLALATLCLVAIWRLIQYCCHWHRTKRYQQINPTHEEEDLSLDEIDHDYPIDTFVDETKGNEH